MKVFIMGDSISMQYRPYLEQYSNYKIHGKTGHEFTGPPQDPNGGDSRMVLDYLRKRFETDGFPYDFTLLNCGLHDIKCGKSNKAHQVPLQEYTRNLHEIVKLFATHNKPLSWVNITPVIDEVHNPKKPFWRKSQIDFHRYAKDVNEYNSSATKIMQQANIPTIDMYSFTQAIGGKEMYCDHVHFTENVRQLQAAYIAGWLDSHKKEQFCHNVK